MAGRRNHRSYGNKKSRRRGSSKKGKQVKNKYAFKEPNKKQPKRSPHWVSPYKKMDAATKKKRQEQLEEIAIEVFGGTYYCIGTDK